MKTAIGFVLRRLKGTGSEYRATRNILNVPNAITLLGVCFSILYASIVYSTAYLWLLPLLHIGVVVSDVLDGVCADMLDQHSVFGKLFDPFRDRLHALVVITHIVWLDSSTSVVVLAIITIFSELMIVALCAGGKIDEPHFLGKSRMVIQSILILYMLVALYWLALPVDIVVIAGVFAGTSISAFISYLFINRLTSRE